MTVDGADKIAEITVNDDNSLTVKTLSVGTGEFILRGKNGISLGTLTLTVTRDGNFSYTFAVNSENGELTDIRVSKIFANATTVSGNKASDGVFKIYAVSGNQLVDTIRTHDEKYIGAIGDGQSNGNPTIGEKNVVDNLVFGNGNELVLVPHTDANGYLKLKPNAEYYVTAEAGTFFVDGVPNEAITDPSAWTFKTNKEPVIRNNKLNVDASGNGEFYTVKGAFDYIRYHGLSGDYTIEVAPGVYHDMVYYLGAANISLIGKGREGDLGKDVVITWKNSQEIANSKQRERATFLIQGTGNMVIEGVTLENTWSRVTDATKSDAQAETLEFDCTGNLIVYDSSFKSHQDTLLIGRTDSDHNGTRAWFYKSYIEGDTDFIWGMADVALFEDCQLKCVYDGVKDSAVVFASRASADAEANKGFVLLSSNVLVEEGQTAFYARNSGADTNASIIGNTFTGKVDEKLYGSPSGTRVYDPQGELGIGYKDYGNIHKSISDNIYVTDKRLEGTGEMSARIVNREYSGRSVILNRGINKTTAVYETSSLIWDISEYEKKYNAPAEDSTKNIFIEPVFVKNLFTGDPSIYNHNSDDVATYNFAGEKVTSGITYTSSDTSKVTVDSNGHLTAVRGAEGGNVTITVTNTSTGKSDTCLVKVINKIVPVTEVEVSVASDKANLYSMMEFNAVQKTADLSDTTHPGLTWKITPSDAAKFIDTSNRKLVDTITTSDINASVKVYAAKAGSFTVTATNEVKGAGDTDIEGTSKAVTVAGNIREFDQLNVVPLAFAGDVQNNSVGWFNGVIYDAVTYHQTKNSRSAKFALNKSTYPNTGQTRNGVVNIPMSGDGVIYIYMDKEKDEAAAATGKIEKDPSKISADAREKLNYIGIAHDGTKIVWDEEKYAYVYYFDYANDAVAASVSTYPGTATNRNNKANDERGFGEGSYTITDAELAEKKWARIIFGGGIADCNWTKIVVDESGGGKFVPATKTLTIADIEDARATTIASVTPDDSGVYEANLSSGTVTITSKSLGTGKLLITMANGDTATVSIKVNSDGSFDEEAFSIAYWLNEPVELTMAQLQKKAAADEGRTIKSVDIVSGEQFVKASKVEGDATKLLIEALSKTAENEAALIQAVMDDDSVSVITAEVSAIGRLTVTVQKYVSDAEKAHEPIINDFLTEYYVKKGTLGFTVGVDAEAPSGETGSELSYQWYEKQSRTAESGEALTGKTQAQFAPDITTPGVYWYYVDVTNTRNDTTANKVSDTLSVNVYDTMDITLEELGLTGVPEITPASSTLTGFTYKVTGTDADTWKLSLSSNAATSSYTKALTLTNGDEEATVNVTVTKGAFNVTLVPHSSGDITTATWDFHTNEPGIAYTETDVKIERNTGYVNPNGGNSGDTLKLFVDATTGKLAERTKDGGGNPDAQFNEGAKIYVPAKVNSIVTVTSYPNYHHYTVAGTAVAADTVELVVTADKLVSKNDQTYVEIVATNSAYLYCIDVVYEEIVTLYDFDINNFDKTKVTIDTNDPPKITTDGVVEKVDGKALFINSPDAKVRLRTNSINYNAGSGNSNTAFSTTKVGETLVSSDFTRYVGVDLRDIANYGNVKVTFAGILPSTNTTKADIVIVDQNFKILASQKEVDRSVANTPFSITAEFNLDDEAVNVEKVILGFARYSSAGGLDIQSITVSGPGVGVKSIELSQEELEMEVDDEVTLTAIVKPDSATNKTVTWKSSDPEVATVSSTGKVTAVKEGTATIIASAGSKKARCEVTVGAKVIAPTSVQILDSTGAELPESGFVRKNGTVQLKAKVLPEGAAQDVTWVSSDPEIAEVSEPDSDGLVTVTGLAGGAAEITAKAAADETVAGSYTVKVRDISLSKERIVLSANGTHTLSAVTEPAEGSVTWESSDDRVAAVNEGAVSAVAKGMTTVTASLAEEGAEGISAEAEVVVVDLSFNAEEAGVAIAETYDLKHFLAFSAPSGSEIVTRNLIWSSSDDTVATVTEEGVVTGVAVGSAMITAEIEGAEDAKATIIVNVAPYIAVSGVTLNMTTAATVIGEPEEEPLTLTATVEPGKATYKGIEWISGDTDVATVNEGVVTGVSGGIATIYAKSRDPKVTISANCVVTVIPDPDITEQPQSITGAAINQDYTMSVGVAGFEEFSEGVYSYRWFESEVEKTSAGGAGWKVVTDATASENSLNFAEAVDTWYYAEVSFTSNGVTSKKNSNVASIVFEQPEVPTAVIEDNEKEYKAGDTAAAIEPVYGPATGGNLTYQWQKKNGEGEYVDIAEATGATYIPIAADLADPGINIYRVKVTNTVNGLTAEATSNDVTVCVYNEYEIGRDALALTGEIAISPASDVNKDFFTYASSGEDDEWKCTLKSAADASTEEPVVLKFTAGGKTATATVALVEGVFTVTIVPAVYNATWALVGLTDTFEGTSGTIEATSGSGAGGILSLSVNAADGKFACQETNSAQFTTGALVYVPATVGSTVTVDAHDSTYAAYVKVADAVLTDLTAVGSSGHEFKLEITDENAATKLVTGEDDKTFVIISATAETYLRSISVTDYDPNAGQSEPEPVIGWISSAGNPVVFSSGSASIAATDFIYLDKVYESGTLEIKFDLAYDEFKNDPLDTGKIVCGFVENGTTPSKEKADKEKLYGIYVSNKGVGKGSKWFLNGGSTNSHGGNAPESGTVTYSLKYTMGEDGGTSDVLEGKVTNGTVSLIKVQKANQLLWHNEAATTHPTGGLIPYIAYTAKTGDMDVSGKDLTSYP